MGMYTEAIQQLYVTYFARPADVDGLQFWEAVAASNNGSLAQVSSAFATSHENQAALANKSHAEIVDAAYQHLFGRTAEKGGLNFWTDLLDRHVLSADTIVESISKSAQGNDVSILHSKVSAAMAFTAALDTPLRTHNWDDSAAYSNAKMFLSYVYDDASLNNVLAKDGVLSKFVANLSDPNLIKLLPTVPAIAVGEPHPGVAVGEPHPGVAIGEPHPGIAIGEPHPGFAVGEPTPGAIATPAKLIGQDFAHHTPLAFW